MIIDKTKYPDVFFPNDELNEKDVILFKKMLSSPLPPIEHEFFTSMKRKEEEEFAPSADVIIDEHTNKDEIYLIRYYYSEYKIGKGLPNNRSREAIYNDSLDNTLNSDLFPLIGRHVSLLTWLQENDFKGINYLGNSMFNLLNPI